MEVYERMLAAFGPQHWWPGDSPFEIMVGAVLVQNTAWRNVERAIDNLREAGVMEPHALYALPPTELAELIRPAGYFQVKARRLRNLLKFVVEEYDGSLEAMFSTNLASLREQLLAIHGIGPETADAILLYAGGLPTFVVDTYTHRVLARHGWIGYDAATTRSRTTSNPLCPPTPRSTMNIMRSWSASARIIAERRRRSARRVRWRTCCRRAESSNRFEQLLASAATPNSSDRLFRRTHARSVRPN